MLHPVAIGSPSPLRTPQVQSRCGKEWHQTWYQLSSSSHWAVVLETYVQGYEEQERQSNTPEAASITGCISSENDGKE